MDNTQDTAPKPPVQPLEWTWITQRQHTPDAQTNSIWKLGFIAPDSGEVRVTFHEVGNDPALDAQKQQDKQAQAQQSTMMGMPPMPPADSFAPPGQPQTDITKDSTFYVTFFANREPKSFMNWDTSLSHDASLQVWITITHGLIDFIRKAQPANVILDDLANGKLKMVLRSIAMDVVTGNPEYSIEQTQKHHYRTLFQIKKADTPSAFQAANAPDQEGMQSVEKGPQDQGPLKPAPETSMPASSNGDSDQGVNADPKSQNVSQPQTPEAPPPFPSNDPIPIKQTAPQRKGLTIEIGQDYSVAVKDQDGNAIDRYRAKGPADILRWINEKGYAGNRMTIVKREMPSKMVQQKIQVLSPSAATDTMIKPVIGSAGAVQEDFNVQGTTVKMNKVVPAKQAALMNYIVNAPKVRCTVESVEFEFETDKDMNFKKALVELAFEQTQGAVVKIS